MKKIIIPISVLCVGLMFMLGFSGAGQKLEQKQVRYVLEANGIEMDNKYVYFNDIPIEIDMLMYNEDTLKVDIKPEFLSEEKQKYNKIVEIAPDKWSLEQWYEVREVTRLANERVIEVDLNGIDATVTFSQKIYKEEIEEFVENYGMENCYYKAVYTSDDVNSSNRDEFYCYGIGLVIKDSETLKLLENDERVFMVDTFADLYHIGRNQKNQIERNGTNFNNDFIREYGKCLSLAMQSDKN